jgi:uncharacterized OB-fold protein
MSAIADWTAGTPGLAYQACAACEVTWYFQRGFCPSCGAPGPEARQASGQGTVCAVTLVTRAPSEELRKHAPYLICLIDLDEGFRVMAHGNPGLRIGDRVQATFTDLVGRLIPFFRNV